MTAVGVLIWLAFFAVWLAALRWATSRAFPPVLRDDADLGLPTPLFYPSIIFHAGLALVLLAVILAALFQNLGILWLGLPGAAAPVFWGAYLEYDRIRDATRRPDLRRLPPYWLQEQWPFAMLGLLFAASGGVWALRVANPYPLLLVPFSLFFLFQFYFFHICYNGLIITDRSIAYRTGFPRWRMRQRTWARSPRFRVEMTPVRKWRVHLHRIRLVNGSYTPIEVTARLTHFQRIRWEEDFG